MADTQDQYLIRIQIQVQDDRALQALAKQLKMTAEQAPKVEQAMDSAVESFRKMEAQAGKTANKLHSSGKAFDDFGHTNKRMGNIAQNTGYQIQDLIVQIQGGTDPMRALSQQLPQLTVGFGAMGAAIGVVGAAIPALISIFREVEEEAATLDETVGDLSSAIENIGDVTEAFNMDNWAEEFNKAGKAAQDAMRATLEYEIVLLRMAAGKTSDALSFLGPQEEDLFFAKATTKNLQVLADRAAAVEQAAAEFGATMGLSGQQVAEFNIAIQQLRDSQGQNAEAAQWALEILRASGVETGNVTPKVNELYKGLLELTRGQEAMREATNRSAQAAQNYGVVLNEITPEGDKKSGGGGGKKPPKIKDRTDEINRERLKAADALIRAGDRYLEQLQKTYDEERKVMGERLELWQEFNPELTKYANEVNRANEALQAGFINQEEFNKRLKDSQTTMEDSLEGWTLQKEAIKLFDDAFTTMLDGVLMGTQDLKDGFTDMAKVIIAQLLKLAAYQFIANSFGGTGGVTGAIGDNFAKLLPSANGNAFSNGNVIPFARGGIVNGPTLFPMAKGMGLMGEAGPEAVMPLSRGRDGKLGVSGGGMSVTVNNMAAGVQVTPRQTENGLTLDVVMRHVSQAIQRGGNEVSDSMERAYSLGRGRGVY